MFLRGGKATRGPPGRSWPSRREPRWRRRGLAAAAGEEPAGTSQGDSIHPWLRPPAPPRPLPPPQTKPREEGSTQNEKNKKAVSFTPEVYDLCSYLLLTLVGVCLFVCLFLTNFKGVVSTLCHKPQHRRLSEPPHKSWEK